MRVRLASAWMIVAGMLLAAPAPLWAEDDDDGMIPAGGGSGPTLHGSLRLSLDEAVAMGLENNLDVEIERHAPLIAFEQSREAWGAYDPSIEGNAGYDDSSLPNAFALNSVAQSENDILGGEAGIQALVPYLNATLGLTFDADRTTTNSSIQALTPEYNSGLRFSGSIPLMRDLLWSAPWTQVKSTRVLHDASLYDFERAVMDTVQAIENAYWELAASDDQLRVAEKSLETRKALLEQTKTQYEVGVVSKVDVVEAEAGVAEGEVNRIVAENQYLSAQDTLIDLVLGANLTATSRLAIDPLDRPSDYSDYGVDLDSAVSKAFRQRPEIAAARKEIERQEIQLKFAKNQRLPRVNLEGGYRVSGLSGRGATLTQTVSTLDAIPPTTPVLTQTQVPVTLPSRGGFGSSIDDWNGAQGGDEWSVRGVVSIPIGNIEGRHRVSRTQLELRRAKTQLVRAEQNVILQVREGARNLASAVEGIEAAQRRRAAAEEQLRAERIRLEHGESTPFDVLQREEVLVEAESQEINSYQTYRTSVAELERAQGTILETRHVVLQTVSSLR